MNYIIVFICLIHSALVLSQKCDRSQFDGHPSNPWSVFGGIDEFLWPETRGQLTQYCRKVRNDTQVGKTYGQNCLSGVSQKLMADVSANFDTVNRQYCARNARLRNGFIGWAKCGNSARDGHRDCWQELTAVLANAKDVDAQYRRPVMCCIYYHWMWCVDNAIGSAGRVCSPAARKGFADYVHRATDSAMSEVCNQYENSHNACVQYLDRAIRTQPKSVVNNPLMYFFDNLDTQ